MSDHNPFEAHLDKNPGNYAALSPLTFIERSAAVYPEHTAVIHGDLRPESAAELFCYDCVIHVRDSRIG